MTKLEFEQYVYNNLFPRMHPLFIGNITNQIENWDILLEEAFETVQSCEIVTARDDMHHRNE